MFGLEVGGHTFAERSGKTSNLDILTSTENFSMPQSSKLCRKLSVISDTYCVKNTIFDFMWHGATISSCNFQITLKDSLANTKRRLLMQPEAMAEAARAAVGDEESEIDITISDPDPTDPSASKEADADTAIKTCVRMRVQSAHGVFGGAHLVLTDPRRSTLPPKLVDTCVDAGIDVRVYMSLYRRLSRRVNRDVCGCVCTDIHTIMCIDTCKKVVQKRCVPTCISTSG